MIVLYILLALFVLLMMVTIHEFGHYVAGKILGFKINEFSIGFGPSLYSRKCKSGEIFSIRLCPLGGYCAFEGEEGGSESSGAFLKQKPWKRIIVLFNGAFFNFISAIIFSFIMLVSVGYDIPQVYTVDPVVRVDSAVYVDATDGHTTKDFVFEQGDLIIKIGEKSYDNGLSLSQVGSALVDVTNNLPNGSGYQYTIEVKRDNEVLGIKPIIYCTKQSNLLTGDDALQKGDVIWKVNGTNVDFIKDNFFNSLVGRVAESSDSIELTITRNGEEKVITMDLLQSGIKDSEGNYAKQMGVKSSAYKFSFGESLARCVPYTFGFSWQVLKSLGTLVTGGLGINDVGGPIYTIGTIANLSSQSWGYFLTLLPLIAANLAVFNWLPIPALDGSKILLTTIEWIIGRPLFKQKTENLIHSIGFFLLLALVFFADFYHIFVAIFR